MQIFKKQWVLLVGLVFISSCKKDVFVDYEVNPLGLEDKSLIKDRSKTNKQFISILYTTLHQQAISSNRLIRTERVIESFGDKTLINEVIVSNYMNSGEVILPTNEEMRADLDQFIVDAYKLFFVRIPSEIEKAFFINYIEANPNVTPELVYTAFASCDEYYFY
ncbi:MAG: hypothetical protein JJ975_14035 [Bacteroidia bacterium]|nr:hypothetical protein [Bacteroidia bacterium]